MSADLPVIFRSRLTGEWVCYVVSRPWGVIGWGDSPRAAYANWAKYHRPVVA